MVFLYGSAILISLISAVIYTAGYGLLWLYLFIFVPIVAFIIALLVVTILQNKHLFNRQQLTLFLVSVVLLNYLIVREEAEWGIIREFLATKIN